MTKVLVRIQCPKKAEELGVELAKICEIEVDKNQLANLYCTYKKVNGMMLYSDIFLPNQYFRNLYLSLLVTPSQIKVKIPIPLVYNMMRNGVKTTVKQDDLTVHAELMYKKNTVVLHCVSKTGQPLLTEFMLTLCGYSSKEHGYIATNITTLPKDKADIAFVNYMLSKSLYKDCFEYGQDYSFAPLHYTGPATDIERTVMGYWRTLLIPYIGLLYRVTLQANMYSKRYGDLAVVKTAREYIVAANCTHNAYPVVSLLGNTVSMVDAKIESKFAGLATYRHDNSAPKADIKYISRVGNNVMAVGNDNILILPTDSITGSANLIYWLIEATRWILRDNTSAIEQITDLMMALKAKVDMTNIIKSTSKIISQERAEIERSVLDFEHKLSEQVEKLVVVETMLQKQAAINKRMREELVSISNTGYYRYLGILPLQKHQGAIVIETRPIIKQVGSVLYLVPGYIAAILLPKKRKHFTAYNDASSVPLVLNVSRSCEAIRGHLENTGVAIHPHVSGSSTSIEDGDTLRQALKIPYFPSLCLGSMAKPYYEALYSADIKSLIMLVTKFLSCESLNTADPWGRRIAHYPKIKVTDTNKPALADLWPDAIWTDEHWNSLKVELVKEPTTNGNELTKIKLEINGVETLAG